MTTTSPVLILPAQDGLGGLLLAVEDAGRALVLQHLRRHRRLLDDGAVGRQVAAEDGDAARGRDRGCRAAG